MKSVACDAWSTLSLAGCVALTAGGGAQVLGATLTGFLSTFVIGGLFGVATGFKVLPTPLPALIACIQKRYWPCPP